MASAEALCPRCPVPVTVFTGYLGSGKTTIILGLIKSLPADYKCVWLKNEFGDMEIDSEVAKSNNIEVKEIINGCLCCVLVGVLATALEQIVAEQKPSRIIIETSGSAYPAPLAWEIRKLDHIVKLDGIVTVIDALNFPGYEDKSFTAREQAKYTDLILINKHELVTNEDVLDKTMDDVFDLNPETPKVKTNGDRGTVNPDLVFGLDTSLFSQVGELELASPANKDHHELEVDLLQANPPADFVLERQALVQGLDALPVEAVFRAKGLIPVRENGEVSVVLFNYVAGRSTIEAMKDFKGPAKLIFMGEEMQRYKKRIASALELPLECVRVHHRGDVREDEHSHAHGHGHGHGKGHGEGHSH